jgi:hypothetical protein
VELLLAAGNTKNVIVKRFFQTEGPKIKDTFSLSEPVIKFLRQAYSDLGVFS